jgi:hypothetical protein
VTVGARHSAASTIYGHTKAELYDRARELGIAGRSKMDKLELARAIARKQH